MLSRKIMIPENKFQSTPPPKKVTVLGQSEARQNVLEKNQRGGFRRISLRYAKQDIFEDYSSNRANTTPFFSETGLRKFVLASEMFVPRPYCRP